MDDLYSRIDTARQFTPPTPDTVPVKDQSAQAAFGLEWAARQIHRPEEPTFKPMPPITPVAS